MTAVAAIFFASQYLAAQTHGNPTEADIKWRSCAEGEIDKLNALGNDAVMDEFCEYIGYIGDRVECAKAMVGLQQIGLLEQSMSEYVYIQKIVPVCGEHP